MATWSDVEGLAAQLASCRPGIARDGSPTYQIGRHPFARLRYDDHGREILQYWTLDPDTEAALADRREAFFRVDTFKVKVSVWAWLDMLEIDELAEILEDSWRARRGVR